MILKTMEQPNRTLYWCAGIYIMDDYDFYYEAKTKVNVFLQEQRQITLLHQFLLPFAAGGGTLSDSNSWEKVFISTSLRQIMLSSGLVFSP